MNAEEINKLPIIFEYTDFRVFLKNWYQYQKLKKPNQFSFRSFAKAAGYSSPNFLKLVMEGRRNLSQKSIEAFASVMKLSRDEARFFRVLVLMNQATTAEEKEIYGRQVVRSKGFRSAQPLKEAQFNYYSKWFFIPIRELVGSKNFKSDPKWVAKTLNPSVSSEDAAQAISELHALGLIEEDASGRFTQTNQVVDTGDEVTSAPVAHFHREMMTKAMESIDRFPSIEREISSASVGISEKNSKKIKTLIQKYRKELLSIAAEDQEIDRIYQINFQFFPLSEKLTKDPK